MPVSFVEIFAYNIFKDNVILIVGYEAYIKSY